MRRNNRTCIFRSSTFESCPSSTSSRCSRTSSRSSKAIRCAGTWIQSASPPKSSTRGTPNARFESRGQFGCRGIEHRARERSSSWTVPRYALLGLASASGLVKSNDKGSARITRHRVVRRLWAYIAYQGLHTRFLPERQHAASSPPRHTQRRRRVLYTCCPALSCPTLPSFVLGRVHAARRRVRRRAWSRSAPTTRTKQPLARVPRDPLTSSQFILNFRILVENEN
jgi:hypothetical protein